MSGFLGILIFSGSLPATRIAVASLDPLFLMGARGAIAGVLALGALVVFRARRPTWAEARSLAIVAFGVVVGYPLFSAFALQHIDSARATMILGVLPTTTALFAVLRGGERPRLPFWAFSLLGSGVIVAYAATAHASLAGDLLMAAGVVVCGLGYAEGATLARRLGGWQVISWALVLALPVTGGIALVTAPPSFAAAAPRAWLGLGYVSVFSMLVGFVFWYRGLALGGIAAVSQLQLLQPFFALALASMCLGEHVPTTMLVATVAVVACVAGTRRFGRISPAPIAVAKAPMPIVPARLE